MDVATRYETALDNEGVFFTDSNGLFSVTRRLLSAVSRLTRIHKAARFLAHAQLHRRYNIDDDLGVEEPLDDRGINDEGIIAKGRHRLHLGTPREAADVLRTAALQEVYRPVYMFYPSPLPPNARKQHSELRVPLPRGGHLMTLEGTEDGRVLVRLENVGRDVAINVSVTHLLHSYLLLDARETVLSAHRYQSEVQRRRWPHAERQQQQESSGAAPDDYDFLAQQAGRENTLVNLQPGQIRTFLATPKAFSMPPPAGGGRP
ncbi:hypothetical protein V5799_020406 [Amblyomma americanum]|uniref:Uncharacterized protein n=1 Tax=Amblyomma americanum TaxID=6943 RepID=A0AAQ4EUG0_AMBAM